jgi:hypothetical protein
MRTTSPAPHDVPSVESTTTTTTPCHLDLDMFRDAPSSLPTGRSNVSRKLHASPRKISANLDEVDALLVEMKDDGESNSAIVAALAELGVAYDAKTVGTRYIRIKAKQAQALDGANHPPHIWNASEVSAKYFPLLLSRFVFADAWKDKLLCRFVEIVDQATADSIARVKAKRWHSLAEKMNKSSKPTVPFTADTVRQRLKLLMNKSGSAEVGDEESNMARALAPRREEMMQEDQLEQARAMRRATANEMNAKKFLERKKHYAEKAAHCLAQAEAEKIRLDTMLQSSAESYYSMPRTRGLEHTDPRANMQTAELMRECGLRGLVKTGTKKDLVNRLAADDERTPLEQLRSILEARGIRADGSKEDLQYRLGLSDVRASKWGQRQASVTEEELDSPTRKRKALEMGRPRNPTPNSLLPIPFMLYSKGGGEGDDASPMPKRRRVEMGFDDMQQPARSFDDYSYEGGLGSHAENASVGWEMSFCGEEERDYFL